TGRDIGCNHLRIALERLAKATPTAAPQPDDLAQFGAVDRALADIVRFAVAPRPDIAACRAGQTAARAPGTEALPVLAAHDDDGARIDRKSTRLNSSHVAISYAVFCLKKKKRSR